MCVSPNFIWVQRGPTYEKQDVNCRQCWQCKSNRFNDYVGRALCEAHVSDWVCALTLTYAPRDDLADKIITPPHFQEFIRSLRRRGHKIRYMAVGEYGELRGRAHFHVILFGKGFRPTLPSGAVWPQETNFHIPELWPHGHVFADWKNEEKTVRYVCKYILKGEAGKYWFSLSKKPAIGSEFFQQKAAQAIALGVMPSSFEYQPPNGGSRTYLLTGACRRDYLLALADGLGADMDRRKLSKWVGEALDKSLKERHIKGAVDLTFEELVEDMREQQKYADTVFSYEWKKRFDKKQKDRALWRRKE